MQNKEKIALADYLIEFIRERSTVVDMPVMVGTLNKPQGIKGFQRGEVGHPVFEYKDRYLIYLESLDGKTTVTIPYYKETLAPAIDFTTSAQS
jgi:hypothetical protein